MTARYFVVGDRVQARTSGFVPQGTLGIVQQVLRFIPIMYYVQFDGYHDPKLMHTRDLEWADTVPARQRDDSRRGSGHERINAAS